jgi:uncharacterized protein
MRAEFAQALGLLAIWLIGLSLNVSRLRLKHKVSFGDGGHKDLAVAIRAHGNSLEQVLLFAVLLIALTLRHPDSPDGVVWLVGVFLAARLLHTLAVFRRWLPARQLAHVASVVVQLLLALALVR